MGQVEYNFKIVKNDVFTPDDTARFTIHEKENTSFAETMKQAKGIKDSIASYRKSNPDDYNLELV